MSFLILRSSVSSGGSSSGAILIRSDTNHIPLGSGSTERVVNLYMINPGETPAVKINGKAQTVLSVSDLTHIPITAAMVHDGLASSATGYVKRVVVRCDNVVNGDTQLTVDGATRPNLTDTVLDFTVSNTGRHMFISKLTGNDTTGDGLTPATAFATFAPMCGTTSGKRAIRGDIWYVMDGDYNETVSAGNSPSQPCIIETANFPGSSGTLPVSVVAYRGHRPHLRDKLKWLATNSDGGRSYLNFAGFEISGCGSTSDRDPMIIDTSDDVSISDMIIHDCTCPYHILGADYAASRPAFILNEIYECNVGSSSNQNHPIYCGGFGTQESIHVWFNHIHDCDGGRGIQLYGHDAADYMPDAQVNWNNVYNMRCDGIRLGGTDHAANPDFLVDLECRGNEVHDNNAAGDPDFADIRIGYSGDGINHGPEMTLTRNICYGTTNSINIENSVSCVYSNNKYRASGSLVIGANAAVTNGGGNTFPYP